VPTVLAKPEVDIERARVRIPGPAVHEISQRAADFKTAIGDARLIVEIKVGSRSIRLSPTMRDTIRALLQLVTEVGRGDVLLLSREAEMTTQEAADALGVSRPFVVSLIDQGILPARKVGSHRRVKASDVQAYQQSFTRYDERMGPVVSTSASRGGYDLRFATTRHGEARRRRAPAAKRTSTLKRTRANPAAVATR
jgi:excisionase family DNA binding protein